MEKSFQDLEKVLKEICKGRPVYYIPNPGNWGDGLIRYGTLKFFKKINLDFKEVSIKELNHIESETNHKSWFPVFQKKPVVIYGGGGAWCKLWNHSTKYINKLQNKYNVIVLPSTYESTYVSHNTIFFTRDKFESKQNMPQATFCHDMAFYIGDDFLSDMESEGTGYFFRTDKESADQINIPSENHDISLDGNHLSDVPLFFESINQFSVIHTDRLHVSIAAALLKKEVHLYPGSYFKNKAVYLSSIKGRFKNVIFHEDFNFLRKSENLTIKKHNLVSIIIPCYNQAKYLEESVQSAVNQTYPNIEIIIVDNESPDNTQVIAEKLQQLYPGKIKTLTQENSGLSIARNNDIKKASGEYILTLDVDDKLYKEILFKCMHTMKVSNSDIVYTGYQDLKKVEKQQQVLMDLIRETTKLSLLRHPIKKYKAYKEMLKTYFNIRRIKK